MQRAVVNRPAGRLCTGAVLLAAGVLLPQIFHLAGGPAAGAVFLPMHIPVLLAGLLLGPAYGAGVGVCLPCVSFLLTGMPVAAKLPFMVLELLLYGLLAGAFGRKSQRVPVLYLGLIGSMAGGRLVYALLLWVSARLFQLSIPSAVTVWAALVTGLPGVLLQLAVIVPLVVLLRRGFGFGTR